MTASTSPWIASGMKEANKPYERRVRTFLDTVIEDKSTHARFMNMLSMLEHQGSKKIMISQSKRTLTEDSLKHLAEEARHAYFFKRHAERVAGTALNGFTEENTMARDMAAMYFARLDAGITKEVGEDNAYPWVSLVVELRACWLYEMYQAALEASSDHMSLKSLLAEEDGHLADMFGQCGGQYDTLKRLSAYETDLFDKLFTALEADIGVKQQKAA